MSNNLKAFSKLFVLRSINHNLLNNSKIFYKFLSFNFYKKTHTLYESKVSELNKQNNHISKESFSFEKFQITIEKYIDIFEQPKKNKYEALPDIDNFIKFYNGVEKFLETHPIHLFKKNIKSLNIVLELIFKIDNYIISNFAHYTFDNQYIIRKKDLLYQINDIIKIFDRICTYYLDYIKQNENYIKKLNIDSVFEIKEIFDPIFIFINKTSSFRLLLLRNEPNKLVFFNSKNFQLLNEYLFKNILINYFKIFTEANTSHKIIFRYLINENKILDKLTENTIEEMIGKLFNSVEKETFMKINRIFEKYIPNSIVKHSIYESILMSSYCKFVNIKSTLDLTEFIQTLNVYLTIDEEIVKNDINNLHTILSEAEWEKSSKNELLLTQIFLLLNKINEKKLFYPPFVKAFSMHFFLNHLKYQEYLSKFKYKVNFSKSLMYLTECNLTSEEKEIIIKNIRKNFNFLINCSEFFKENLLRSLLFIDIFNEEIFLPLLKDICKVDFIYMSRSNLYNLCFVILTIKKIKHIELEKMNNEIIDIVDVIEDKLKKVINQNFMINNKESFFERSIKNYLIFFNANFEKNHIAHKLLLSYSDFYCKEKNLILELDGPHHFLKNNKKYSYNQASIFKKEILKKLGYNLISIPFYEWHDLINDKEKIDYLKIKFEEFNIIKK